MSTAPPTTPSPVVPAAYPATLDIDYPDRNLNRLTSFFRIFTIIPIAIVLGLITSAYLGWGGRPEHGMNWQWGTAGVVFLPLVLMILFRKKYPKWWFDWNLNLARFGYRVNAYFALMSDVYPSTDEEQYVHLNMVYPDAQTQLGRGMPIIKWFLAIPHYIILAVLGFVAWIIVIIAWFAILFTGRYPKGMFDFVLGVMRWGVRVEAYAFILITDKYPPFSLSP
jgi:hypothetical protein